MTVLMVESWLHSTGLMLPPLLARRGLDYVLLTRDPALYTLPDGTAHPVLDGAAEVVVTETNDDDAVTAAARDVAADRAAAGTPVRGVLTTCDYYLPTVGVVAEALGLPGPSAAAMRTATRKHLVRRALAVAGVPDVAHAVAATWADARAAAADLGYPLVVKPVDLNSGTAVRRVEDEAGLAAAFAAATGPERNSRGQRLERLALVERVLDGPECSIEAVTRDGVTRVVGITAKSVTELDGAYVESGHLFPAPLDDATRAAVERHVVAALDAVGYTHGVSHTEVRLTASGPRVVELNPRQGGGFIFDLVRLVTGLDPLGAVVDLALGHAPVAHEPPRAASAAVAFLLAADDGELRAVPGGTDLADDPRVIAHRLPAPGRVVRPADNNDRLGHVMTADPHGGAAKEWADDVVASLRLDVAAEALAG
ncbi:ATP-grasp domain-containing protein [Isoptericola sp. BMS4]|uniref:ATP-grasp domain-containing protein n=1 Tax=Isoptericola sp. BMS4 TaxID=2527875 RepID=UPI001421F6A3|nr:ATP-grasp domain-containing protein [Isoptericola sp. BMS4]